MNRKELQKTISIVFVYFIDVVYNALIKTIIKQLTERKKIKMNDRQQNLS